MAPDEMVREERRKVLVAEIKSQCLYTPTNGRQAQAQGCAPPPQVVELWAKTALFAQSSAGPGRSPDPALAKKSGGLRAPPYGFEKHVKIRALGDEGAGPSPLRLTRGLLAEGDPAEDDDPQRRQRLRQLRDQLHPAPPLQHQIEDEGVGAGASRRGQHVRRVRD